MGPHAPKPDEWDQLCAKFPAGCLNRSMGAVKAKNDYSLKSGQVGVSLRKYLLRLNPGA